MSKENIYGVWGDYVYIASVLFFLIELSTNQFLIDVQKPNKLIELYY